MGIGRFAGVCWRVLASIEVWGLYGGDDGVDGRRAIVLLRCVGVGLGTPNSGDRAICWRVLACAVWRDSGGLWAARHSVVALCRGRVRGAK